MKLLILSDIHGSAGELDKLSRLNPAPDALVVSGDLTHFGGEKQAVPILESLRSFAVPIVAIHGNCDESDVEGLLHRTGVSVHRHEKKVGEVSFLGLGGSLPAPTPTPSVFSEEEAASALQDLSRKQLDNPWIFLVHQPPFESEADQIGNGKHVGSKSVADFIRVTKPVLVCTGHIHESFSVSNFEDSLLVNPGSLKEGRYAVALLNSDGVTVELKKL